MELGPVFFWIPIQIGINLHLQRATEAAVVYLLVFQVKVDGMRDWQQSDLFQTVEKRHGGILLSSLGYYGPIRSN